MNWTHIFRIFESTRECRHSAVPRGFFPALKALFTAPSGSRRLKGRACAQSERLETRQVLSAANLPVVLNLAAVSEPEPTALGFEVLTFAQTDIVSEVDAAGAVDVSSVLDVGNAADEQVAWTSSEPSWEQFDLPGNLLTTASTTIRNSVLPAVNLGNLTISRDVTSTTTSVPNSPALNESLTSTLDEVFHDSGSFLESPLPASIIDEPDSSGAASTVLPIPEVLTPASNNPIPVLTASGAQIVVPVVQDTVRKLSATASVFVIPVAENSAPVSISATPPQESGWNWRTASQFEFAARTLQTASVAARQSQTVSGAVARSVGRRSMVSAHDDADHGWLAALTELSGFSTDADPSMSGMSSSTGGTNTLPVAVPLVSHNVDQQLSPQNLAVTDQTKVKPYREGHRQNSTSTKLVEVAHQHDSLPDLFDSEDVPRALRYVVLPRGPPRKQPDTVLRIMDSDAEAHVLQRLRYSMAPRGPSTVTVEMQSPEKRSFSGPRVSPEESLSVRLVC